jgi:hypothetical protein
MKVADVEPVTETARSGWSWPLGYLDHGFESRSRDTYVSVLLCCVVLLVHLKAKNVCMNTSKNVQAQEKRKQKVARNKN